METFSVNVTFGREYDKDILEKAFGVPSKLLQDGKTRVFTQAVLDENEHSQETAQAAAEAILANYSQLVTAKSKEQEITELYVAMEKDVLNEMASTFGTTNTDSATAYEKTWEMMLASPAEWSGAGLTARFNRGELSVGDALDTDAKVTAYAQACVACHGADGKGNQAVGAPNLTDNIWLYGGSEKQINFTLKHGRNGVMPAWKEILGEDKIHVLAGYVYSLSKKDQE